MVRKLRTGLMPPKKRRGSRTPRRALALVTALETALDAAAAANPNPGRRVVPAAEPRRIRRGGPLALRPRHRRQHAICPPTRSAPSFDNIADVQTPSATVMQGYMRAAAYVSRVAVGDPSADPTSATQYDVPRTQSQKDRVEGAPFGTRGGTVVTHIFPADGKYKFQLLLHGEPAGLLFGRTVRDIQMEVAIDGERAALLKVDRWISESDPEGPDGHDAADPGAGRRAQGRRDVHPGVRGRRGRPHQADRPHAGRHADRRRLRRDDAAAPAEPGGRRARSR